MFLNCIFLSDDAIKAVGCFNLGKEAILVYDILLFRVADTRQKDSTALKYIGVSENKAELN